ncbi:winged helix-turn-helix transcriptional regulator, partial [Ectothiorhodospira sp. 9905]|uniref:winged helix-turn-helix transcriptional regulator n=1 Tax=Ectothiorhodospira sp. 9905 TaxID=2897387 RepID=UPI00351D4B5D
MQREDIQYRLLHLLQDNPQLTQRDLAARGYRCLSPFPLAIPPHHPLPYPPFVHPLNEPTQHPQDGPPKAYRPDSSVPNFPMQREDIQYRLLRLLQDNPQ